MSKYAPVTAEEIESHIMRGSQREFKHHDCSICGVPVRYVIEAGRPFFDGSCGCASSYPSPREWGELSGWINMQSTDRGKEAAAATFGYELVKNNEGEELV